MDSPAAAAQPTTLDNCFPSSSTSYTRGSTVYIQVISINEVIWEIVPLWCSSILKATAVRGIGRNVGVLLLTGCRRNIRQGY